MNYDKLPERQADTDIYFLYLPSFSMDGKI